MFVPLTSIDQWKFIWSFCKPSRYVGSSALGCLAVIQRFGPRPGGAPAERIPHGPTFSAPTGPTSGLQIVEGERKLWLEQCHVLCESIILILWHEHDRLNQLLRTSFFVLQFFLEALDLRVHLAGSPSPGGISRLHQVGGWFGSPIPEVPEVPIWWPGEFHRIRALIHRFLWQHRCCPPIATPRFQSLAVFVEIWNPDGW